MRSASEMAFETLLYDVADGVAILTLNRPDRLNAVNTTVIQELVAAFDRCDADDGVRAVIVTGAGRAFCAGADLGGVGKRPPRINGLPSKDMPPFYPWWT